MKVNLISAIMRGDEFLSIRPVTPSAWAVYYKLVAINNRLGWKTIVIKTSINALSHILHTRPTNIKKGLSELLDSTLIMIQGGISVTNNQLLSIILLPKERDETLIQAALNGLSTQTLTDEKSCKQLNREDCPLEEREKEKDSKDLTQTIQLSVNVGCKSTTN